MPALKAEVDLVTEFNLPPRQNVHFMMVTGQISQSQAALYIAETTSGKFGVYSMHARNDGQPGVVIDRNKQGVIVQLRNPAVVTPMIQPSYGVWSQ